jgi:ZIP family zinc transporter
MTDVLLMILFTLMAGLAMPAGALLAQIERIHPHWLESEFRHSVVAFGGGALLSAVALVLVPEGAARLEASTAALCFTGGGLAFMVLDVLLAQFKTRAGQLAAMLSDFIPESLALGAAFAYGSRG